MTRFWMISSLVASQAVRIAAIIELSVIRVGCIRTVFLVEIDKQTVGTTR